MPSICLLCSLTLLFGSGVSSSLTAGRLARKGDLQKKPRSDKKCNGSSNRIRFLPESSSSFNSNSLQASRGGGGGGGFSLFVSPRCLSAREWATFGQRQLLLASVSQMLLSKEMGSKLNLPTLKHWTRLEIIDLCLSEDREKVLKTRRRFRLGNNHNHHHHYTSLSSSYTRTAEV